MKVNTPAAVLIGWQVFAANHHQDSVRRAARWLAAFREAGILVLHAQLLSLPTTTSRPWQRLQERDAGLRFPPMGSPEAQFVPELEPIPSEPVVESYRASVFLDTRLPLLLRSNGMQTVILSGPGTHTSILPSAVTAACLDFEVIVSPGAEATHSTPVAEAAVDVMGTWASVMSEIQLGEFLRELKA